MPHLLQNDVPLQFNVMLIISQYFSHQGAKDFKLVDVVNHQKGIIL